MVTIIIVGGMADDCMQLLYSMCVCVFFYLSSNNLTGRNAFTAQHRTLSSTAGTKEAKSGGETTERQKLQKAERSFSKETRLQRLKSEDTVWYGQVTSRQWQTWHTSKSDRGRAEHGTKEHLPPVLLSLWQSEWAGGRIYLFEILCVPSYRVWELATLRRKKHINRK